MEEKNDDIYFIGDFQRVTNGVLLEVINSDGVIIKTKVPCKCPCHTRGGGLHVFPCCENGWVEVNNNTKK